MNNLVSMVGTFIIAYGLPLQAYLYMCLGIHIGSDQKPSGQNQDLQFLKLSFFIFSVCFYVRP